MEKRNRDITPPKTNVQEKNIPAVIKKLPHWGLWYWKFIGDMWTKIPIDSKGKHIDAKKFNLTCSEALKLLKKSEIADGVGFNFTKNHDIFGIDFDDCVKNGKITDKKVKKQVEKLASYTEESVSGTGLHTMGKGAGKLNGIDKKFVYDTTRYFTFTGNIISKKYSKVKDISKKTNKIFGKKELAGGPEKEFSGGQESDISLPDLYTIIMNIRPDIDEADWFIVCKAIHNKTMGTPAGYDLYYNWSIGNFCKEDQKYKRQNGETKEQWLRAIDVKWNRCKTNKKKKVGIPKLRKIEGTCPVNVKQPKLRNPFKKTLELKDYTSERLTLEHLPKNMRKACKEVSRFNKIDVDPIATSIMMVFSAAINKKVKITERDGLFHNCSMACLIAMPSGGRKSAIDKPLMLPYLKFESQQIGEWQKNKVKNEQKVAQIKTKIKEVKKDESYTLDDMGLNDSQIEVLEGLKKEINKLSRPRPKFIESDATEERLSDTLDKNNETIFIQSDDARNTLKNISGRYDNNGSENIYIAGITGDTYRRSRVKDDIEIILENPCLNMSLKVQMDLTRNLVASGTMHESGMIARMFIKVIDDDVSKQYEETYNEKAIQYDKLEVYNDALTKILNYEGPTIQVRLSEAARRCRVDFSNEYAKLIGENGEWSEHKDVSNKIVSLSVKMATVYAIMRNPGILEGTKLKFGEKKFEVILADYKAGRDIVRVLMNQTLDVLKNLAKNDIAKGAKELLVRLEEDVKLWEEEETEEENQYWTEKGIMRKFTKNKRDFVPQWVECLISNKLLSPEGNKLLRSGF